MLKKQDYDYLAKRRRFAALWPMAAWSMLAVLAGFSSWLFIQSPYLVNPVYVFQQLKSGAIDTAIMEIAALLLPAVTLTLLAVVSIIIVFGFSVFANEKRYLAIIDALIKDKKQP
ncbi:MAG: hypothetical protein ACXW0H_03775 [Methylobacter sp.]